jgi:alpha-L-rhamnosidase
MIRLNIADRTVALEFHRVWVFIVFSLFFAAGTLELQGQTTEARWISPSEAPPVGVYSFRKTLLLDAAPARYLVHVSADNRFILYVNGMRIGDGPARGDLSHWRYETFDLGTVLHKGSNVIAARVWNFGSLAPIAQLSMRTGFVLWSDDPANFSIDTNASWLARTEPAWTANPSGFTASAFHAIGPGERLDGTLYDWTWNQPVEQPSETWSAAVLLQRPKLSAGNTGNDAKEWGLIPDQLPHMEYKKIPVGHVVRSSLPEVELSSNECPTKPLTIASHTHATILLDRNTLKTAYPEIVVSKGKDALVQMTYAEGLYDANGQKGDRNDIQGKHMDLRLLHDEFLPDGGPGRSFIPLWWRTWRYLQLDIETKEEPLQIDALHAYFTSYPFQERAIFRSSEADLEKIWDVGWRTIRLDTHETYMDCPAWEQLQYAGDTRIQTLVTYVMSGDDRLATQALRAFANSRLPNGLTESRYPNHEQQVIPPFSLLWIGMLHDYWWYRPDTSVVKELLPVSRTVLDWYVQQQQSDGLLGKFPANGYDFWNFVDWAWVVNGVAPEDDDGGSIPPTLQFVAALRDAADLESAVGDAALAAKYRANADRVGAAVYREGWDEKRGLLADTPAKKVFSQQANILGVLLDVIPRKRQKQVLRTILADELAGKPIYPANPKVVPASYYFRFYLARAVEHAGMGNLYLQLLGPWHNMLRLGLSTWAETPEPTRSDAHAWSSHPNYDLLTLVAGIHPASPGFTSVRIAPHLANLNTLDASMPHPEGTVSVSYHRSAAGVDAHVTLPLGVTGVFDWNGKETPLHSGEQDLRLQEYSFEMR